MSKFRKKPVVIEAILWNGNQLNEFPEWLKSAYDKTPGDPGSVFRNGSDVLIYTLEGTMTTSPGDYIIQGVNGELYPCKPDIFEKTYEPA